MSINLEVFNKKEIQQLNVMLSSFIADGVTDIRAIQVKTDNHLLAERQKAIKPKLKGRREQRELLRANTLQQEKVLCPSCRRGLLAPVVFGHSKNGPIFINPDGLRVNECKKCRYSEVL